MILDERSGCSLDVRDQKCCRGKQLRSGAANDVRSHRGGEWRHRFFFLGFVVRGVKYWGKGGGNDRGKWLWMAGNDDSPIQRIQAMRREGRDYTIFAMTVLVNQ